MKGAIQANSFESACRAVGVDCNDSDNMVVQQLKKRFDSDRQPDQNPIVESQHKIHKTMDEFKQQREANRPKDYKADYIQTVTPYVEAAAQKLGVDPKILIAQSALETGYGRHVHGNNMFNIKADKSWHGESENGYRKYGSYEESFNDYADFIKSNPRYSKALENPDNYIQEISKAGFAEDKLYSSKINSIMNSRNMGGVGSSGGQSTVAGLGNSLLNALKTGGAGLAIPAAIAAKMAANDTTGAPKVKTGFLASIANAISGRSKNTDIPNNTSNSNNSSSSDGVLINSPALDKNGNLDVGAIRRQQHTEHFQTKVVSLLTSINNRITGGDGSTNSKSDTGTYSLGSNGNSAAGQLLGKLGGSMAGPVGVAGGIVAGNAISSIVKGIASAILSPVGIAAVAGVAGVKLMQNEIEYQRKKREATPEERAKMESEAPWWRRDGVKPLKHFLSYDNLKDGVKGIPDAVKKGVEYEKDHGKEQIEFLRSISKLFSEVLPTSIIASIEKRFVTDGIKDATGKDLEAGIKNLSESMKSLPERMLEGISNILNKGKDAVTKVADAVTTAVNTPTPEVVPETPEHFLNPHGKNRNAPTAAAKPAIPSLVRQPQNARSVLLNDAQNAADDLIQREKDKQNKGITLVNSGNTTVTGGGSQSGPTVGRASAKNNDPTKRLLDIMSDVGVSGNLLY
jgi:hypothetical protein